MKRVRSGGGWPAVRYAFRKAREAGGVVKMWKAMRRPNACKTCALGMGGQRGGMVNELGRFPEVCKKALQAQAADMQRPIPREFWREHPLSRLEAMSPRELEACGRLAEPLLLERGAAGYRPVGWDERLASDLRS